MFKVFFHDCFGYSGSLEIPYDFRIFCLGDLDRNYIEFVDCGDSNNILTMVDLQFITIECISIYLCL